MGYSGRYHAASLAAVFVALAIGILIGVGLADDVVSGASQELEDSLRNDHCFDAIVAGYTAFLWARDGWEKPEPWRHGGLDADGWIWSPPTSHR